MSTNPFDDEESQHSTSDVRQALQLRESNDDSSRSLPVAVNAKDENAVIRFLVSDRVYGYPSTNGTLMSNYFRFVFNKHPLLSIFLHYRLDPYTTKKRLITFICILCFAVAVSYLLLSTTFVYRIAVCREGCSTSDNNEVCIGGFNNGLSYSVYWEGCNYYRSWMLPILAGAVIVVYGSMLRFFASCGCVQGREFFRFHCLGSRFRQVIEFFGGFVLSLFSLLSLAMAIWVLTATYMTGSTFDIFIPILIAKAWSFGEWFIWTLPYFLFKYPWDKRHFNRCMREVSVSGKEPTQQITAVVP